LKWPFADDLDAGDAERLDVAAQHVEVPLRRRLRDQVHARLDHGLAVALRLQRGLDRGEDLVVGQREPRDVGTVQVGQINFLHRALTAAT
jgi:hypothetical protein